MADNNDQAPKQAPKKPALYHVFMVGQKRALHPVGEATAKTAEAAVKEFLKAPPDDQVELVEKVKQGKAQLVLVPERNYTEFGAQEEVRTRLTVKAVKN